MTEITKNEDIKTQIQKIRKHCLKYFKRILFFVIVVFFTVIAVSCYLYYYKIENKINDTLYVLNNNITQQIKNVGLNDIANLFTNNIKNQMQKKQNKKISTEIIQNVAQDSIFDYNNDYKLALIKNHLHGNYNAVSLYKVKNKQATKDMHVINYIIPKLNMLMIEKNIIDNINIFIPNEFLVSIKKSINNKNIYTNVDKVCANSVKFSLENIYDKVIHSKSIYKYNKIHTIPDIYSKSCEQSNSYFVVPIVLKNKKVMLVSLFINKNAIENKIKKSYKNIIEGLFQSSDLTQTFIKNYRYYIVDQSNSIIFSNHKKRYFKDDNKVKTGIIRVAINSGLTLIQKYQFSHDIMLFYKNNEFIYFISIIISITIIFVATILYILLFMLRPATGILKNLTFAIYDNKYSYTPTPNLPVIWQQWEDILQVTMKQHSNIQKKLYKNAYYDNITNIPNKKMLLIKLEKSFKDMESINNSINIMFLKINNLHEIITNHGFYKADNILKIIVSKISKYIYVSSVDLISRISNNEFIAMFEEEEHQNSSSIKKIASDISEELYDGIDINGLNIKIDFNIGISKMPDHTSLPYWALHFAEQACLYAKKTNINYVFYKKNAQKKFSKIIKLRETVMSAIQHKEFNLYYQPQIDNITNKVVGAESFIVWEKQDGSILYPEEFIPAIEQEEDLITKLETLIMEKIAENSLLFQNIIPDITKFKLLFKIQKIQLSNISLISAIKEIVFKNKIPDNFLCFKAKESSLVHDIEFSKNILKAIKELNIKVALDNFGTGYSSISHLHSLPIDYLIINHEFIKKLETSQKSKYVLESIINLSDKLNIKIIIQGIETQKELDLINSSFDNQNYIIQGNYYSKPLPLTDFIDTINFNNMTPIK